MKQIAVLLFAFFSRVTAERKHHEKWRNWNVLKTRSTRAVFSGESRDFIKVVERSVM